MTNMKVQNRFFGMRDLNYLKAGFQDLKANKNWGPRFAIESLHGMRDAQNNH